MATKTKPEPTPTEQARAEVQRLDQTVAEWEQRAKAARARLEEVEQSRGREILAAGDDADTKARTIATEIAELRAEAETAGAAAAEARAQADQARGQVLRADASELRAEAARMHADADERQEKTDRLLADLQEHEGVTFRPAGAAVQPVGASGTEWVSVPTATDRMRAAADRLIGQAIEIEGKAAGVDVIVPHGPNGPDYAALARQPEARRRTA